MEQESQMIQGTVLAVIYQNPENGYCVLKVRTEQGEQVTVVGTIPMSVVGERLAIVGKWTRHQSFGQQFEAEFLERLMPETTSEILAFLSSRAVKGIGPRTAEKIVGRFGDQSLTVLEQDPMRLTEIPGITEKKAQEMAESFQRQSGIRRLIEFLTMYHLPAQLAVRLYRAYGELAQEALQDDPYLLTDPYYSADFSQVDAFAIALGVSADDERRVEAGILFELSYNLGAGHTFIPQDKLRAATCALLELDGETIDAGFTRLQEQERMQCSELAGLTACYLPELYEAETYVCRRILSMAEAELPEPKRLDALLETIEDRQEIDYAPEQLAAIRAAAAQQLLIVTGGPGTGKTTVMAGILQLFDELKLKTQLAAPTGRAAKRLSEVTGREASTIHRLLEAQFDEQMGAMAFYHDEDAPLSCDAMIVDETSMVDLPLMASRRRPGPAAAGRAGERVFGPHPQRHGADRAADTDLPPGAEKPHRHERPRGQPGRAAAADGDGPGLFLPAPPRSGRCGADHPGALPDAAAQKHGHRARGHSGAQPQPEARDGHEGPESGAAGRAQPARGREKREKTRRFFLPDRRSGNANPE